MWLNAETDGLFYFILGERGGGGGGGESDESTRMSYKFVTTRGVC